MSASSSELEGQRVPVMARLSALMVRPDPWLKPLVFLACLAPFIYMVYALAFTRDLGANPIEALCDLTGNLAIRILLISLALTPIRWWLKATWPVRLRRMVGLFAFFYALLHFLVYALLDQGLDLAAIATDIVERPYVLAGTAALLVLIPLAITSPKRMARRMGRRWQSLHRWVYLGATAAVVHYVLLAKGDLIAPYVYLGILMFLLGVRMIRMLEGR